MGFLNTVIIDSVHLGQTKKGIRYNQRVKCSSIYVLKYGEYFFQTENNCQWDFLMLQLAFKSTKVLLLWTKITVDSTNE